MSPLRNLLARSVVNPCITAVLCGLFYHHVSDDIGGFQNRLGLGSFDRLTGLLMFHPGVFFFTLALFGFSCLSSLGLFANERILFMRERCGPIFITLLKPLLRSTLTRSNGYYSSFTYFTSKVRPNFSCGLIQGDDLYLDPIRYPSATRRPTIALWGHCVRPRWLCSDRGGFLEVHPHASALQPDHGKRNFAHLNCMCEHERCESDRHDGHVVQVSPDPHVQWDRSY